MTSYKFLRHSKSRHGFFYWVKRSCLSLNILIIVFIVGGLIGYLNQNNLIIKHGFTLQGLEQKIQLLNKTKTTINLEINKLQSLAYLQNKVKQSGFVKSAQPEFISSQYEMVAYHSLSTY
ncbi:MAG: hypothetical protein KAS12_06655 [Candidatus Aenigmarchaeota archaeon]|nr:hypothetical protein [Candidatus Aenigmarchaeota archaeon]